MDTAKVEHAIAHSEWIELVPWLIGLHDDERAELRRAYRAGWRAAARRAASTWNPPSRIVQIALAIALSESPDEAHKNCAWGRQFVWTDAELAFPLLSRLLATRDDEWAGEFAELAAATALRGEAAGAAIEIAALTLPIYARTSSPVAEGTLPLGWVRIVSSARVASQSSTRNWVPIRLTDLSGAGGVAYELPTRLLDVLRATPRLSDVLVAALRTPDCLTNLATFKGADWDVEAAVRALIAADELDRELVIDETLAALARADRPSGQRVMAAVLRGTDLRGADAAVRASMISHIMPTVHGSVTGVLLAAVLASEPDDDTLLDIGAVILARTEKAQKQLLVRGLARATQSPAAEALLAMAASDADASLAGQARAVLKLESVAPVARASSAVREIAIEGYQTAPFVPWPADAAGLDAARSDGETWVRITSNARELDLAVRFAHRDSEGLRAAVLAGAAPNSLSWWTGRPTLAQLHQWFSKGEARRSYEFTMTSTMMGADGAWIESEPRIHTHTPEPHHEFTDRLVEETIGRLGTISELLSTPSTDDGALSVDDLARRLTRVRDGGVGPYDLVQALLRLEPASVAQASQFDRIVAPLSGQSKSRLGRRPEQLNAGAVIAEWIRAGGLPVKLITADRDALNVGEVRLPLPPQLARLDGLSRLCASDDRQQRARPRPVMSLREPTDVAHYLGVVPHWLDAAAVYVGAAGGESAYTAKALTILTAAPGALGVGSYDLLVRMQSHPRQDSRLLAVDAMAAFARQGRLDAALLAQITRVLLDARKLSLSRVADSWHNAIRVGLGPWIWPSVTAALSASLNADRMPAGLADLLRVVSAAVVDGVASVGEPQLLDATKRLAESRSSSKAAQEARVLVDLLTGSPQ